MKESEKINKYSPIKDGAEHKGIRGTNCTWCALKGPQRLRKKTDGIGNSRKN